MPAETLPTKKDLVANLLGEITQCEICHEPFHGTHTPTRIRDPVSCQKVFGSTCLQE
jgi:hypothetical protein